CLTLQLSRRPLAFSSRIVSVSPSTSSLLFFFLLIRPPPISTLFPYTTLFRSLRPSGEWARPRRAIRAAPRPSTRAPPSRTSPRRSEEHTSELQSLTNLVCRLLLEKKKNDHHKRQDMHSSHATARGVETQLAYV